MIRNGTPYSNRLVEETSPYLLQHAHNPVDWYPWGSQAFEKARLQNKPIFLSVGYSTCHWCHVMAHESFEDERIAAVLNEHFVPVKVDREERPDVDAAYMTMVQAMSGSGGWPLSVFLTPEGKAFYGGTYFPPASIAGRPGFYDVLLAIHDAWNRQKEDLLKSSEQLHRRIQSVLSQPTEGQFSEQLLQDAYDMLEQMFDKTYGGFGTAPKFPQPGVLSYLLTYHHRTGTGRALEMVEYTLRQMAAGGIHDHLGGGFHRYSVDGEWFEPHFEKMLYDQAMLSRAFIQAYQVTGTQIYAQQACGIVDYVLRDLTHPSGGFYSAEDADSEGQEGLFYLWGLDEVMAELGPEAGPVVASCYGLTPQGNFKGKNILHVQNSIEQIAVEHKRPKPEIEEILRHGRERLAELRRQRVRPGRDEKIITAWNGLMMASLAQAGAVLERPRYVQAAEQAARFMLQNLRVEGRLRRSYAMEQVSGPGFLEDYALLIQGLLDLYEATFDPAWLAESLTLAEQMIRLFEDTQQGGFFFTAADAEQLVVRQKPVYDEPIPSGNSAAAVVLMKLGQLTGDDAYFQRGRKVLQSVSQTLQRQAAGMCNMLIAADFALGPRREVVIAGPRDDDRTRQFMAIAHQRFMPRSVALFHEPGPEGVRIEQLSPFIRSQGPVNGKPAVYMCENYTCQIPLTSPADVQAALENIRPSG